MSQLYDDLLSQYFDDQLTEEKQRQLEVWIRSSPDNTKRFIEQSMLHDQLHNASVATRELNDVSKELSLENLSFRFSPIEKHSVSIFPNRYSAIAVAVSVGFLLLCSILFWGSIFPTRASASAIELERLIKLAESSRDRTYLIEVEETLSPAPNSGRRRMPEAFRPPKPSLHRAMLYTRGESQFVLIRKPPGDEVFVTGFDGDTSWAIRNDGPAKVSKDPNAFNRDVPGHEHSMSFTDIRETLETLKRAYLIELLPVEISEAGDRSDGEAFRLIVAIKRGGEKGPRRVEINYLIESGRITQIRFLDMPYGPDRLTLRMTLIDESDLGSTFFHHEFHYPANRPIESE